MCVLTAVSTLYAQDKYPQVTKFKQKCYEIYDNMGEAPSEMKDLVYKKINHLCDSIVNASSLEYPYIDLQLMPKKRLVETAKSYAVIEYTQIKEKQAREEQEKLEREAQVAKFRAEREARAKREKEEREKREKEEAERKAAEMTKLAELEANLPNGINQTLKFAREYDEIFNAEAYEKIMDIFDMYLNGKLKHTNTKTSNGIEFVGWVNDNGIPYGFAIVTKHLDANIDYVYSGLFYDGKPIFGELKTWAPRHGITAAKIVGFVNLKNQPYNNKPTFAFAEINDSYNMMRYDSNGKIDGLLMEYYVYRIVKDTQIIANINTSVDKEKTLKQLYDYFIPNYPQTATKVVEAFPLGNGQIYTGGWKDGKPAGAGVSYLDYEKYAFMVNGDDGTLKCVVELDADKQSYYNMMNTDNLWYMHNRRRGVTSGLLVPHNNFGIGIAFSYNKSDDEDEFTLSTVKTDSDNPSTENEISYKYLKSFTINLKSGYIYFKNIGLNGEELDFMGINCKKGTYTIRQSNKANNKRIIKLMCNDGTYFEGDIISNNEYLGVHYGKGNYVYVGYVDDDVKYNGQGYLMDATDGEIMRQGLWNNNNLTTTMDLKNSIDIRYPINKTAVLETNKNILDKEPIKLAPAVKFEFPNVKLN